MSNSSDYIMAFDFGTSGTKAVLVDFDMKFVAASVCGYPLFSPEKGYAEQSADDYWKATCQVARDVMEKAGVDKNAVKGISFGSQAMGIIPVDKNDNVIHNNITWVDSRAGKEAERINHIMGTEAQNSNDVVSKLLWLKENKSEIYNNTKYFLDCTGYLVFKSTGIPAMELTNSSPYSLNPQMQKYQERLYAAAGIDLDKMPPLKICGEYVANLTSAASEQLGLATEAKVFMGTGDVAAAAAGAGCCQIGDAHFYIGSSAWLSVIMDENRLENPSPGAYQIYSINKDLLIYGGCVQSACMTLDWAIEQFYQMEGQMLKGDLYRFINQEDIFNFINGEIKDIEPGSRNMIATPWLHGEHFPVLDEKARAVFFNITNLHDRRYFINAVMEGIAYSLRGQMELYTQDTGNTLTKIGVVGGGALSDHWMQILADIIKVPVYRPENVRHAGAIGAAFVAGVGLGLYKMDDLKDFIRLEKSFYPREENAAIYDKLYGVFKRIYPSMKEMFAEINN